MPGLQIEEAGVHQGAMNYFYHRGHGEHRERNFLQKVIETVLTSKSCFVKGSSVTSVFSVVE